MMKGIPGKIMLMALAIMMSTMTVNAQNAYEDYKNEVAISLGGGSNSDIISAFETLGIAIVGVTVGDESFFGPVSAEYFYHMNSWLGVGGILAYGQMSQDFYLSGKKNGKDGEIKNSYTTLMPAVKFDWFRKKYFGAYSKLAIGATLRSERTDYNDDSRYKDNSDDELHVNWQVSLIGLEFGSQRLRGFVELGTGEQGIGLIGLRYKF